MAGTTGAGLSDVEPPMQDLLFVILTVAFFAVAALIVKGVERL